MKVVGLDAHPAVSIQTGKGLPGMKLHQTIVGLAALLGAASAYAIGGSSYRSDNDFSIAQNPNGVWSYGYSSSVGGTFSALTASASIGALEGWYTPIPGDYYLPAVYHNASTSSITVGTVTVDGLESGFLPGPSSYAIYRFTAPAAGSYNVDAFFRVQDTQADGADVHVLRNGATLFSGSVSIADPIEYWNSDVTLAAGGTVDFVLGNGGTNHVFDATVLGAQITAVPEPHGYALFGVGLGLIGMTLRRHKVRSDRAVIG